MDEITIDQRSSGEMDAGKSLSTLILSCVGRMEQGPGAIERRWESQVQDLRGYASCQFAVGIEGEAVEFEWKFFTGFSTLSILHEIPKDLEEKNIQPKDFSDRIIFM